MPPEHTNYFGCLKAFLKLAPAKPGKCGLLEMAETNISGGMKSHELFAVMAPALASEILEYNFAHDKKLYRATLEAVAQARKVRAVFLERQPRVERHASVIVALNRPALELAADSLLRNWLLKAHSALLTDFLDALKITHEKGAVENLPPSVEDAALLAAVDGLLAKYPAEVVVLYLHAFSDMNETRWANLVAMLQSDGRLKLERPVSPSTAQP